MDFADTSRVVTAVVTLVTVALGCGCAAGLYLLARYRQRQTKAHLAYGTRSPRSLPVFYALLAFVSLLELAMTSWLLGQYAHTRKFASVGARVGLRGTTFAACWTLVFTMVYSTYLIHPTLVKSVVVSIESQSAWTLLTWCIWVGCTATLNRAVPLIALKSRCAGADYCTQLRSAFALALTEVLILTIGMLYMSWMTWRSYRTPTRTQARY